MRSAVALLPLDRPLPAGVLAVAVADADPPEVMPPVRAAVAVRPR
ncbi:hypothetical protein ACWGIB_09350 [Streptomyces xiamenensis]